MSLEQTEQGRPVVLVTGVGRTVGIGAGIALRLAEDGWDVATTHWTPYDDRMPWGRNDDDPVAVAAALTARGARTMAVQADLSDVRSRPRCSTPSPPASGPSPRW